ncbi:MAG TPA: ABC transporter substrate-binding protein [Bacteroidales bacterium]|nr:ABC transporter substrate-binding protein [Bacteroidales bacterium]HOK74162.1 ABC transporter substrate-binding protein [Bacteroidales bacterium]HOM39479.1 ABC transporter substrate-binding protein [Bacteroidales bacterium]HOU31189.1 ABC transporter substrate-binding protein [Bacteroidales bacterium]HPP91861.1 ABC transporter substrate-binding protein [Bacteroidales bacterium]
MVKKYLSLILLFSLVLFLLCECRSNVTRKDSSGVYTIATLKGPSSMGMIKLIDSLNSGGPYNVKATILDEPMQVRKMMIDKTADFAILPTTMAAIIYNKGFGYKLVAVPVWGTLYLVGSDSTVKRWDDLRGRRVHVMARGMTPDELFRYLLRKNGIDPEKEITLDYSFPTHVDLANAVGAGRTELAVLSEPLASMVMKRNGSVRRIFSLNEEWAKFEGIPIAETAFMAKEEMLKNNRDITEKLLSSYEASTNWVNLYPDSAATLIVKYGILPDYESAFNAIPLSNLKFARAKDVKKEVNEYLSVFYRMNPDIVGGKVPDENFIYQ